MKKAILIAFIIGLLPIGFSQDFNKAKLDSFFLALSENNQYMGSVALAKDGEVFYTKTLGYADVENEIMPDIHTKYRIGSISKTFTATLVLKAIEEKKLTLNTKLKKFFPKIKNAQKITIENLLYHRTGIGNFTDRDDYYDWNTESKTEAEIIAIIADCGSDFKPNEKFEYSNSNYVLLSFILEKVYEQSYPEILEEKIIQKIGLKNTAFGGKINPENNESFSYKYTGKWEKEGETNNSITMGAGAIISTPSDLIQFAEALFEGKIISLESVEKMKTLKNNFGMGLFMMPFYSKIGYGHTGGVDGFSSALCIFFKDGISMAHTSNASRFSNNDISIAMLSAAYNQAYSIPVFESYDVSEEELVQLIGTYKNEEHSLEMKISNKGTVLIGQIVGQPSIAFEATDKNEFKQRTYSVVLQFNPEKGTLQLLQAGQEIQFIKQ